MDRRSPPASSRGQQSNWRTYGLFGLRLVSDFPFATALPVTPGKPDVCFTCVLQPPVPPMPPGWLATQPAYVHPAQTSAGKPIVVLYRLHDCDVLCFPGLADFYLWSERIVCHLLDDSQEHAVELCFLGTVLAFWQEQYGSPTLHASSVVVSDRAVAFVGTNASGKTSLAASFMQTGARLVCDDILALRCYGEHYGEHIVGLPSYPQLRLWPDQAAHFAVHFLGSDHDAQPLSPHTTKLRVRLKKPHLFCHDACLLVAIYLPERRHSATHSPAIEIVPVSPAQALVAFIRHAFAARFVNDIASQQRRLALFTPVVQQIPIRRLVYPNGFAYLPAVREAILKDIHMSLPSV